MRARSPGSSSVTAGTRAWAAALLTALALSACTEASLGSLNPLADGDAEPEATAEAATAGDEGSPPLPEPRLAPGAPDEDDQAAASDADSDEETDAEATAGPAAADAQVAADAAVAALDAPHVYMSLQPEGGGSTSVVFAIDRSRDGTPSDEPAIRITPEETEAQAGRCNPQQLRYYKFPPESAGEPVYGPEVASRGVAARDLPGFMATAVSAEMMERGIADDLEGTRPQNVCTRKLFEQTIIAATTGQG